MSLHAVKGKNSSEFIDIYASTDSDAKLPKYKMPDDSSDRELFTAWSVTNYCWMVTPVRIWRHFVQHGLRMKSNS